MTVSIIQKNRDGPKDYMRLYREDYNYRALINQSIAPIIGRYSGCVLDAGCGGGFIANLLQKVGFETMGIDKDVGTIVKARDDFPAVSFLAENIEDFVKCGWYRKFDFIICMNVIHEIKDPQTIVDLMQLSKVFMVVVSETKYFPIKKLKELFKDFRIEKLNLDLNNGAFNGLIIYAKKKGKKT